MQLVAVQRQLVATRAPEPARWPSVAVLRPCEGAEPAILERFASAFPDDYPGAVTHVVAHGSALAPDVRELLGAHGAVVVESRDAPAGCNRKAFHLCTALAAAPADAEVIVALDADVEVAPGLLRALVAAAVAPGAVASFAPPVQQGAGAASRLGRAAFAGSPHAFVVLAGLSRMLGQPAPMVGCAVAMRRDALDAAGGFAPSVRVIGDDLALGEALARRGSISMAHVPADCRNPTQRTGSLVAQLARWIRVAVAHGPWRAASYPLVFAPMVLVAAAGALVAASQPAFVVTGLAGVYALRVALAWQLRRAVYGAPWECLADPWLADATWFAATLAAAWPARTRWAGNTYRIGAGGRLRAAEGAP